ncbi:MAG: hypothetical protein ABSH06_04075 [Thermodesulfobacteriota bacterium]
MKVIFDKVIAPKSALAFGVKEGQYLRNTFNVFMNCPYDKEKVTIQPA